MGPESRIVKSIVEKLKAKFPGIYIRKIHGNQFQHAGIPDLVGCVKGRFFGIEVKTTSGRRSRIQELEGEEIQKNFGIYGVATDAEEAVNIVLEGLNSPQGPQHA